ncbi:MAG: hypothetical protein HYX87_06605 [Chloroflexi bacterium]|nr:hypothetical protein [Chloroflexota bacterium]
MDTIFTVHNTDLERLSAEQAVDLFRELLWAEATTTGIAKNLINVPSAITVQDGGVDAEVQNAPIAGGQGLIKQGLTRYQIKTGSFSLSGDAHVKDILFRKDATDLKPRIKSCLDIGGTLVVVLFGWDNPETQDTQVKQKFIQHLRAADGQYADAKIEVWRQNNLRSFLSKFPSLALSVTGHDHALLQSHRSWSRQDDMLRDFVGGVPQHESIETLRTELRKETRAVHVRVWGEAGIGKTKLVLEATRADDISPLVVYCDAASKFRDSSLMNELMREDNSFSVVLVVDECDSDSRSYIWNKFKHCGPRIKLVSIYSELDPATGDLVYIDAPPLVKEQVLAILQSYDLPKDQAERWSDLCGGSPRVAHVIGANSRNNGGNLLMPLDTVNVWARWVEGSDPPDAEIVRQRKLVLRYISLFKRFGYRKPLVAEAQAVAKLVEQADRNVTWPRFQEIITNLRQRKILQGETTLYVTPRALHVWLWLDWWTIYGETFDFDEFTKQLPPALVEWFMEMFVYAAGSEASAKSVSDLLGPHGPFRHEDSLRSEAGARFFLKLSEADPKSALACLKRTVGEWSKDKLLQFTDGRRQVVWALQNIAVWRDLFHEAVLLLLALGEAENEHGISNNASGVFTSLFAVGPGPVASTEAPAEERLSIIRNAISSDSGERRRLAIAACSVMLEARHWARFSDPENQGLRPKAHLWVPKTYGEWYDACRLAWQLLREAIDNLPEGDRSLALDRLIERARGLTSVPNLADMVIDTVRDLASKDYVDKKKILGQAIEILHYDGEALPDKTRKKWEEIRDELTGSDFSALMRRYVGMDLLEDRFDEQGNRIDQAQPKIERLAQQAVDDAGLLMGELPWLVTSDAENGFGFGYALGERDVASKFLPVLLDAQKSAGSTSSLYLLGGYFRALREKDAQAWESQLDALARDPQTVVWVPEITWRSGTLSDMAARRVLQLAQLGTIAIRDFRMFAFGGVIRGLSKEMFEEWISYLLDSPVEVAVPIALDLYTMYYHDRAPGTELPEKLTSRLLTHDILFQAGPFGRFHMEVYDWAVIGRGFLRDHPEASLVVAEKMLEHWGEEGSIIEGFHSEANTLLNAIARRFPREVWLLVTRFLGPPIDARAFHIREWLRGDDAFQSGAGGMLEAFPPDELWQWVDGDADRRAWYAASFVPASLFRIDGKVCLARELLIRYGEREEVRRNLMANFSTEGWSGSESEHYRRKRDQLLDFVRDETEERVKHWIDEYVSGLNEQINVAVIREEREES